MTRAVKEKQQSCQHDIVRRIQIHDDSHWICENCSLIFWHPDCVREVRAVDAKKIEYLVERLENSAALALGITEHEG